MSEYKISVIQRDLYDLLVFRYGNWCWAACRLSYFLITLKSRWNAFYEKEEEEGRWVKFRSYLSFSLSRHHSRHN